MSAVKHADDCKCRDCARRRNDPTTETCDSCGKRRLCQQVTRDPLDGPKTWDPHYCVSECLALTGPERAQKRQEARENRRSKAPPLAWPIIGGPLDGTYAVPADFYGDGCHAARQREYTEWNAGHGGNKRIGGFPTMIFVHRALIKPLIRGKDR